MPANPDCFTEEKLIAFSEGKLPAEEVRSVEAHLQTCDACQGVLAWVQEHLLSQLDDDGELPAATSEFTAQPDPATVQFTGGQGAAGGDEESPQTTASLGRFSGYEIVRELGHGGFGIVYEAHDQVLNRKVAIKVLKRGLASLPTSRRRFIREARAGAAINHPNVVTIHSVEESGDTPFLTMELVSGETLRDRIRREPKLDVMDVLRISAQIAQGLAAAHAQGIIHRDVKPGNILLIDSVPRVKITDFGLARVTVENVEYTSRGLAIGTPAYMSPEQVRGEELDVRSDLFALGCVMYAMFTGHSPFHGRTTIDIARRIDSFEPPPLCETHKAVPEFLSAIVQRLLKKDRESRYQTAAEVADVLNRHLAVLNSTPTDRLPEALKMQLAQTPRKGNRLLAAVVWPVLVVLGIAAAGIGLSYFGTGDMRPPTVPPVARVAAVTVAKSLTADFTTIGEALKHVAPGGSVTILDDAEYVEPIRLTDGSQHAAVRLVSPQRARLRSEGAGPVVFIRGIAGLRLEGLRIEAAHGQFGIEIHGSCPGLHLENIEIPRSPNTDGQTGTRAGLYLHYGAAGSAEQPIVVRGLALRSTIVGIVIGNTNVTDSPPRHILLEESLIEGIGRDQATLLVLKRHSEGVIIRRNLFVRGLQGLSVDAEERAFPEHCQISHNTWHDVRKWLAWKGPAPEQPSIRVTDNLIIDAEQLDIAFQARGLVSDATAAAIFANNVLFNRDGSSTDFSPLTRTVADVPILSFDSGQPDYLKPDIARWRASGQAPTPIPGRYSEPDLP